MASTSLALAARALCLRAGLETPTARPDLSERACLLTVPSPAPVKSLGGERPLDAGSAEVRLHVHQVRCGLMQQEYGCLATELAHNQC